MSEIETTRELSRSDVASYLREFADQLDDAETDPVGATADSERTTDNDPGTGVGRRDDASDRADETTADDGKITLLVGNDSATINPPELVEFEVAVDSDSSLIEAGTRERVSFALEWDVEAVDEGDDLEIT